LATIQDVARLAGVSTATVSRVISGRGYVSPASRQQVLAAADELDYVPNGLARGLKTQRSGLIALLVPEIVNSFYTTISRGVEDVANTSGLQVILGNTDESVAKERAYVELMISTRVDGVIIAPAGRTANPLKPLLASGVPTVLVDRAVAGVPADVVRGDSMAGAQTLTKHLLALGHRRIALINGHRDTSVARDREAGFRAALADAHVEIHERLISSGTWFIDDAEARTGVILDANNPPTAIFAANNFMAIGALRALRERGRHVPEDMALVCFDDIPDAAEVDPFLTALAQPAYTMGTLAMQLLLERISGTFQDSPREIVLSSQLLIRRSCGAQLAAPAVGFNVNFGPDGDGRSADGFAALPAIKPTVLA
jgi:LacI family transcriptional regulator, galactose operon repressor